MTIQTKFSVANLVWFLDSHCRPQQGVVTRVIYSESKTSTEEEYCLLYPVDREEYERKSTVRDVSQLGRSKEDLQQILNSYFK